MEDETDFEPDECECTEIGERLKIAFRRDNGTSPSDQRTAQQPRVAARADEDACQGTTEMTAACCTEKYVRNTSLARSHSFAGLSG
jgi:hypothetical protein